MTVTRPKVNKETYRRYVTHGTKVITAWPIPRARAHVFTPVQASTMAWLHKRVLDLLASFEIGNDILGIKSKVPEPDITGTILIDRLSLVKGYQPSRQFLTRAFNEVMDIAYAIGEHFDRICEAPWKENNGPCIFMTVGGVTQRAYAPDITTAYNQAVLQSVFNNFRYKLRPLDHSGLEPRRLHNIHEVLDAVIAAATIVGLASELTHAYASCKFTPTKKGKQA